MTHGCAIGVAGKVNRMPSTDDIPAKLAESLGRVRPSTSPKPPNGKPTRAPKFELVPFEQLTPSRERAYLIKDLFPRTGLCVVWGPPKCGKSFWTMDAMLHAALNWQYRGRKVAQGRVVYCAFEGQDGYGKRIEAFRQQHQEEIIQVIASTGAVAFHLMPVRMDLVKEHRQFIAEIRAQLGDKSPDAIVLDTLNRSLVGSESSDEDMTKYIGAADALREAFDCLVVIVHHCGIEGTRPRGHTSLTGAADAQIAVKRDATGNVLATVEWMKDGPEGAEIISRLNQVSVGTDTDGDDMTTCVIEPADNTVATMEKPDRMRRAPKAAKIAFDALREAIGDLGTVATPSDHVPAGVRVTTIDRWRDYAYRRGISTGEARAQQKAFKAATEYLIAEKRVGVWNDDAWIIVG